jgi:hypothetical protein
MPQYLPKAQVDNAFLWVLQHRHWSETTAILRTLRVESYALNRRLTDEIMYSVVRRLRMHAFVTGATGFTGTGIVEGLIRCLPLLFTAPSTLQTRGGNR